MVSTVLVAGRRRAGRRGMKRPLRVSRPTLKVMVLMMSPPLQIFPGLEVLGRLRFIVDRRKGVEGVDEELHAPLRFLDADIASDPAFRTAGAVRMLCGEASARKEQWPKFSLALATEAYRIAEQLPLAPEAKNLLLGIALREQANAGRYLLPSKEVIARLDKATDHFRRSNAAEAPFELAMLDYIRAVMLVQLDETTEEALRFSRRAVAVFRNYADETRELTATLAEAVALHYLGNAEQAIATYEQVTRDARRLDERLILGYALKNAAIVHRQMNRLDDAEALHAEAASLFDELQVATEKVSIEWDLALIAVRRGDLAGGAAALDTRRRELLQLDLKNDFALATLDWAEVRLELGQPEGVADACRGIIMQFEAGGMRQKAAVALDYVKRALAAERATPALVREVRHVRFGDGISSPAQRKRAGSVPR
jgi:tetratricopeptide (TPR) repeat protein